MAVNWTVAHTRGSEYLLDPSDIVIKPELNGRYEDSDIEGLIADILERGQLQAVLIRQEAGKKPVLVAGFRRWRSIGTINKRKLTPKPLPIRCTYFRGDEREGFLANLAENRQRNGTTPLDDAHNCRLLESWGMSVADIAVKFGEKPAWVRNRLKLAEATPELKAALKAGRLKPTAAATLAALTAEQQRSAVRGEGPVKQKGEKKPGVKELRTHIVESYGDTTLPKAVRAFCRFIIKDYWPAELREEAELEQVS